MFSKRFPTFADWFDHAKPGTSTFKRVVSYHYRNPDCTLAEARGHKPKKPPRPELFKCSWGLKHIPIESKPNGQKYYGALLQAWSFREHQLTELKNKLLDVFLENLGDYLGYSEGDWWFLGYTGPPHWGDPLECTFEPNLEGIWEFIVEKDTGQIVYGPKVGYLSIL